MSCAHCGDGHEGVSVCPRTGKPLDEPGPCGTTIDRYAIVALLSSGGFGAVYRGRHIHTQRAVAVKLLDAKLAADPAMVVRFKREAQALAAIDSPHVVQVLDWGVRPTGEAYLVMELLQGRDLRAVGRVSRDRALAIARQLLAALRAVHAAAIVHRDLKPANVVLVEEPLIVKLIDFGISKHVAIAGDPFRTATGSTFGSAGYMAPEQIRTSTVDARADVYAAGVVIYELLAGALPFAHETYADYVVLVCTEEPRPITEHAPDLPPAIAGAVMRAIAREPDERWQTVDDFARALAGDPVAADAPTQRERPATQRPRATRHALGAVVALAIAGGVAWWALRDPATPDAAPIAIAPRDAAPIVEPARDAAAELVVAPADAVAVAPAKPTKTFGSLSAKLQRLDCFHPTECPLLRCTCKSGAAELGSTCAGSKCASVEGTCTAACAKHGGWAGGVAEGALTGHARRDRDCEVSSLCASAGRCRAREGECVKEGCRETTYCKTRGLCADDGDECRPSDEGCAASEVCRDRGECAAGKNQCAPGSDADCRASKACRVDGLCVAAGARCAVGSEQDCASSERCASEGRCKWATGYSACFK